MAETGPGAAGGYVAFISYSHKDAAIGRWLHRKLEGYRLPKRLAGTQGEDGEVPARLTPIFRDRDELPAAGDLSQKVRAALALSRNLIVLCSPNSAASPWVAKEIATFRELHPGRPVFTATTDGEPAQCFPQALLDGGIEPLAADLRKEGDGRRLGLLKLVAGLSGVGLDALVQRDASRRIRRVTYVTATAVMAMLMMAVMTTIALNARAEAQRQRAEAEGLVEFMLTDLRDRLEGVGRLDILTSVNRRALDYYQVQDLALLPVTSLERRARLLHAMGEDEEKRGNLPRALAHFQEAARTTKALLTGQPLSPERKYVHAQSEYWVGLIAWRINRFDAAEKSFRIYADLSRQVVRADPNNLDWLLEAGYAHSNLGTLLLRAKGDFPASERHFKSALSTFETAARRRPDDTALKRDLADAYAWLADSQRVQGRLDDARANRAKEFTILDALREREPRNEAYRQDLIGNGIGFAMIEIQARQLDRAADRLLMLQRESKRHLALDPSNVRASGQNFLVQLLMAKVWLLKGEPGSARALLRPCPTGDAELEAFCAILAAEVADRRSPIRVISPPAKGPASTPHRLTPRWGLDLQNEPFV